jgi:hypothetical protein
MRGASAPLGRLLPSYNGGEVYFFPGKRGVDLTLVQW